MAEKFKSKSRNVVPRTYNTEKSDRAHHFGQCKFDRENESDEENIDPEKDKIRMEINALQTRKQFENH